MNKLSLFQRKSGGPHLIGRAAQVSSLPEPMCALWTGNMNNDDPQHKQIRTWLK